MVSPRVALRLPLVSRATMTLVSRATMTGMDHVVCMRTSTQAVSQKGAWR